MFWQDKHFLSSANIANEIELLGRIEWMRRMKARVRKAGGWERVRLRWGGLEGGGGGLVESGVKEKEYCSGR